MKKPHSPPDLRLVKCPSRKESRDEVQVSVEITNDELTDKERAELLKGARRLLQDIFSKNPDAEVVVVDDTHTDAHKDDGRGKGNNIINFARQRLSRKGRKR